MPLWSTTKNNMINIIKETKTTKPDNRTKINTIAPDKILTFDVPTETTPLLLTPTNYYNTIIGDLPDFMQKTKQQITTRISKLRSNNKYKQLKNETKISLNIEEINKPLTNNKKTTFLSLT